MEGTQDLGRHRLLLRVIDLFLLGEEDPDLMFNSEKSHLSLLGLPLFTLLHPPFPFALCGMNKIGPLILNPFLLDLFVELLLIRPLGRALLGP